MLGVELLISVPASVRPIQGIIDGPHLALLKLREDGTCQQLYTKWFGSMVE
jgi:ABC-type amino acid transport substrate-binding protein